MRTPLTNLDIHLLQSPREIAAIADEWRALAERSTDVFTTPEWRDAAIATYGPDNSVEGAQFVAIARDDNGELAWVLPLAIEKAMGITMIRFPGHQLGDIFVPAWRENANPGAVAADLAAALVHAFPDAVLMFDNAESDWAHSVQRAPALVGYTTIEYGTAKLPWIDFDDKGWTGYLASRSRNFRSQTGRRRRNLEKNHDAVFRMTTERDSLATDLDTVLDLHEMRWDERGGSGAITPTSRAFHHRFAASALERGWLRLWILELDGQPAAGWYGWRFGSSYSYYQAGFDPQFENEAVGTVLLVHTIQAAAEEGAKSYGLLLGDEEYKQRFATDAGEVVTFAMAPRRSLAAGLLRAEAAARRLVHATPEPIKRWPMKAARGLVRRLPSGAPR